MEKEAVIILNITYLYVITFSNDKEQFEETSSLELTISCITTEKDIHWGPISFMCPQ